MNFQKEYDVNFYTVDMNLRALPQLLVDFYTDCDLDFARFQGVGVEELHKSGLTMMLQKREISFYKPIYLRDRIVAKPTIEGIKGSTLIRKSTFESPEGELLSTSRGLVHLVKVKDREKVQVLEKIYKAYGIQESLDYEFIFHRIPVIEEVEYSKEFEVRYSDLDSNKHVNNSKYLTWALETLPVEYMRDYFLEKVRIAYLREILYGDSVRVVAQRDSRKERLVTIQEIRNSSGLLTTVLECTFKKLNI